MNKPLSITARIQLAVKVRCDRFRNELEEAVEGWLEDNINEVFVDGHTEDGIVTSIEGWGDE